MKKIQLIPVLVLFVLASCSSVRVNSDYDKAVDFSKYKTYAYHKNGIDKVEISDLDKKRILHAIDAQMQAKGMIKSETPDLLVNIFTKEQKEVDVNRYNVGFGYGWGYGWSPFGFGMNYNINQYTEGTLFIDLIDAQKKELVWEGQGVGTLTQDVNKKDEMVNNFVTKILAQFPPQIAKK